MAENFFGLFTSKLFFLQKFRSLEYFKQEQIGYLSYYNNRHIIQTRSDSKERHRPALLFREGGHDRD